MIRYLFVCFLQEKLSRLLEALLYSAAETSRALYRKYALVRSAKHMEDESKERRDKREK